MSKQKKTLRPFEVTLRRDIQEMAVFVVDAYTSGEAADVAESLATAESAWQFEAEIGTHRPSVRPVSKGDR